MNICSLPKIFLANDVQLLHGSLQRTKRTKERIAAKDLVNTIVPFSEPENLSTRRPTNQIDSG